MTTQRQLQLERLKGRADVAVGHDSNPPPELEIDPRFEGAFPEQAKNIGRFNQGIQRWWREFIIGQTKE